MGTTEIPPTVDAIVPEVHVVGCSLAQPSRIPSGIESGDDERIEHHQSSTSECTRVSFDAGCLSATSNHNSVQESNDWKKPAGLSCDGQEASQVISSVDSSQRDSMVPNLPRELRHMLSRIMPRTPRYTQSNGLTSRPSQRQRTATKARGKDAARVVSEAEVQAEDVLVHKKSVATTGGIQCYHKA